MIEKIIKWGVVGIAVLIVGAWVASTVRPSADEQRTLDGFENMGK